MATYMTTRKGSQEFDSWLINYRQPFRESVESIQCAVRAENDKEYQKQIAQAIECADVDDHKPERDDADGCR